ncbi:MAG: FAD-dependent oxidoreductase [Solidesulfovibrio sp. DCME]|uniref:FAD-dependent oxidoreductase n=1 Tax=Solidesulfovibrio sp. DCME TaxID=3447380 RepID=UPI003D0EDF55
MEAMNFNFLCDEPPPPSGASVGIIGAGPSGLAAAGYLSCLGHAVEVYDKMPKPGGLMLFGIPGHRIPSGRIEAGTLRLARRYGVVFHTCTKICCSAPLFEEAGDHFATDMRGLGDMVKKHDAIMIATGSWRSRRLEVAGEDLAGVLSGLEFLFPIRAARYCAPGVTAPDVAGKRVVVIGAGHSAVDAAHGAVALGAAEVTMLYRRTRQEAPCGTLEIERLEAAGVRWVEGCAPTRILGSEAVSGLEFRRRVPGGDRLDTLAAEVVVTAIGEVATPPFARELGLESVRKGEVRWLNMTAIENVFVAGDALTGPSKIGKAIYSGLRAARSLGNWLELKAQNRQTEFSGDGLISREADRFPGGGFKDAPRVRGS